MPADLASQLTTWLLVQVSVIRLPFVSCTDAKRTGLSLFEATAFDRLRQKLKGRRSVVDGKAPSHYQTPSYDRQTLTSPSDGVSCLIVVQHALFSSDTRHFVVVVVVVLLYAVLL